VCIVLIYLDLGINLYSHNSLILKFKNEPINLYKISCASRSRENIQNNKLKGNMACFVKVVRVFAIYDF